MKNNTLSDIQELFQTWAGCTADRVEPLPITASNRRYFRIIHKDRSVIAAWNDNPEENEAFLYLSEYFASQNLPVPRIFAVSNDRYCYLQQDLGSTCLFDIISTKRTQGTLDDVFWISTYTQLIRDLIRFQLQGKEGLDFSRCYPSSRFSEREIHWDLNYFKHYFLRLAGFPFHEDRLQDGFDSLVQVLMDVPSKTFMYRDFQARNVMVFNQQYYYIDYQGGRLGPLHYDLASLLFNSKADIPYHLRETLLSVYLREIQQHIPVEEQAFRKAYYAFALLRVLQAMGAYGFRGYFERKPYFLTSIPYGQRNLKWLMDISGLPVSGELKRVLLAVANSERLSALSQQELLVRVCSFSYKRGIPADLSGHGGGFVFDCRILPNPGRIKGFEHLTGRDPAVISFLKEQADVSSFLEHAQQLSKQAVQNYTERNFSHLTIHFGCTGGQHRSVFCAEETAAFLKRIVNVKIHLTHLEMDGLP